MTERLLVEQFVSGQEKYVALAMPPSAKKRVNSTPRSAPSSATTPARRSRASCSAMGYSQSSAARDRRSRRRSPAAAPETTTGLPLHLGLHAGDVIREDNDVYGGAVNIASRISGLSAPGEVWCR